MTDQEIYRKNIKWKYQEEKGISLEIAYAFKEKQ